MVTRKPAVGQLTHDSWEGDRHPTEAQVMLIQEQIRNYIIENLLFGSDNLRDEDSFLEHGVVDSTGVLELVLFAEETFGITVDEEEILPDHFDSISSLARYVTRKLDRF